MHLSRAIFCYVRSGSLFFLEPFFAQGDDWAGRRGVAVRFDMGRFGWPMGPTRPVGPSADLAGRRRAFDKTVST